jgi:iron uptake system component EfeO
MQFFYQRSLQLVLLLVLSIALVACGGGNRESINKDTADTPASASQQSAAANATGTTVNVVAQDFEFLLDNSRATAGTVTFVVTNEGSMPHDFAITVNGERHKTSMIQPGGSQSLSVELQAGSYEYICTVPGHDILGMRGMFTVE